MDVAAPIAETDDDAEPGHITVIFNPTAGRRRHKKLRATLRVLAEMGFAAEVVETLGPGHAEKIARNIALSERGILAVAGGDGTINEAVNVLLSVPGPLPTLAVIPLGTANVLAQEIGLGTSPRAVAHAIAGGRRLKTRPGRVNGRHFLMMVGAGFDGAVVAGVNTKWKRRVGRLAYVFITLVQAWRFGFPAMSGEVDGRPFDARWAVICRGRHYGGPFVAAPKANLADPHLTVCLLPGRGPWAVTRYGLALLLGRIGKLSDARVETGTKVRVNGVEGLPVQGDGDIVARLPIEIEMAEREIELIVP